MQYAITRRTSTRPRPSGQLTIRRGVPEEGRCRIGYGELLSLSLSLCSLDSNAETVGLTLRQVAIIAPSLCPGSHLQENDVLHVDVFLQTHICRLVSVPSWLPVSRRYSDIRLCYNIHGQYWSIGVTAERVTGRGQRSLFWLIPAVIS